jgi:farnesyl diphosphate synthase
MKEASLPASGHGAAGQASGDSSASAFPVRMAGYRERLERALESSLAPATTHPARLHTAIRYAVLGGGKRLRPLLVYATAEWLGLPAERVDAIAVAVELVHAYSLVHDDLPAMDDDDLRRGRATVHLAFDEATAILVGDALQALAYRVLAADAALVGQPEVQQQLILDLAGASGSEGMVGGQMIDIASSHLRLAPSQLEDLHARKTGRLLHAAVIMPCRLRPDLGGEGLALIDRFGRALGLAFQMADDLLDVDGRPEVLGKSGGSDARNHKATLPVLLGVEGARRRLEDVRRDAHDALARFGAEADGLRWISGWVASRDR